MKKAKKIFTLTIDEDMIQSSNEIQWMKQYVIDLERPSRDEILLATLSCYAKKLVSKKLKALQADKMKVNLSPKVGRRSKKDL